MMRIDTGRFDHIYGVDLPVSGSEDQSYPVYRGLPGLTLRSSQPDQIVKGRLAL